MKNNLGTSSVSRRIDWVDCAKGIAIFLVIVGHSVQDGEGESILRGIIFSFHMPLFFILSCVTYKCSMDMVEFKSKAINGVRCLLQPAIVTYIILVFYQCVIDHSKLMSFNFWRGRVYTLLYSSGVKMTLNNFEVAPMGMPWFFFTLFIGRTIFDLLHQKFKDQTTLFIMCSLIGMVGIIFGKLQWLPFSMDIAFAVMPFFNFGNWLRGKNLNTHPIRDMLVYGLVWLSTLYIIFPDYKYRTYLELATRRYTLFPVCYITAIAGTMFVVQLSILLCKLKFSYPLLYVGKNSLYLFCVHILDGIWSSLWKSEGSQLITVSRRVIFDFVFFMGFMVLKEIWRKFMKDRNLT